MEVFISYYVHINITVGRERYLFRSNFAFSGKFKTSYFYTSILDRGSFQYQNFLQCISKLSPLQYILRHSHGASCFNCPGWILNISRILGHIVCAWSELSSDYSPIIFWIRNKGALECLQWSAVGIYCIKVIKVKLKIMNPPETFKTAAWNSDLQMHTHANTRTHARTHTHSCRHSNKFFAIIKNRLLTRACLDEFIFYEEK